MRSELDPAVVAARLEALRALASVPTHEPDDTPVGVDRDRSPEAVSRRLEELRALCDLADYLTRRRPVSGR